jgi:hypothetical protein
MNGDTSGFVCETGGMRADCAIGAQNTPYLMVQLVLV